MVTDVEVVKRWSEHSNIAVIGDSIYDQFEFGATYRISNENRSASVLCVDKGREKAPGGAANVAANIAAMGGSPLLFTVMGDEHTSGNLTKIIRQAGVDAHVINDPARPTTRKQRFYNGDDEILCVEWQSREPIATEIEDSLFEAIQAANFDIVIVSDYDRGVITKSLMARLIALCDERELKLLLDIRPREDFREFYHGSWLVKPNWKEVQLMTDCTVRDHESAVVAGKTLAKDLDTPNVLITRGADGMSLIKRENGSFSDHEIKPFELRSRLVCVSGGGDTVIATLALVVSAGGTIEQAVQLSAITSAIAVRKPGTSTVKKKEVLSILPE